MPIAPIAGQAFKTQNNKKASIILEVTPDAEGFSFMGSVQNGGAPAYHFWKPDGTGDTGNSLNLVSLWPTDSPVRYQPIMTTPDGTWRVMTTLYTDLNELKAEWVPKGCLWAVEIDRNGGGNPTVARIALT